jgi:anti-sigma factor RsiW
MTRDERHLSDRELLQAIDGELSPQRAEQARAHLVSCDQCEQRSRKFERATARFTSLHREELDSQLPSGANPRAALKAQITEAAIKPRFRLWLGEPNWVTIGGVVVLTAFALGGMLREKRRSESSTARAVTAAIPRVRLTPGVTRPITQSEVCRMPQTFEQQEIPIDLQRRVFQEYGLADAKPADYEVDYLITPELGGASDIRNLWPEPHSETVWNSYVKDALEERLRRMVCHGHVDLPTAQREISTDWIAAYKKYFHTSKPVPGLRFEPGEAAEPKG